MKKLSESLVEIKKSKFIGLMYEVKSIEEVDSILAELKKEHKKARHICYAYKIGTLEKKTDDKEPSGTAGQPILNIINYKNLDNTLIIVVRYFGGTLLGRGLLTRSYSEATSKLFVSNN